MVGGWSVAGRWRSHLSFNRVHPCSSVANKAFPVPGTKANTRLDLRAAADKFRVDAEKADRCSVCFCSRWRPPPTWPGRSGPCRTSAFITTTASIGSPPEPRDRPWLSHRQLARPAVSNQVPAALSRAAGWHLEGQSELSRQPCRSPRLFAWLLLPVYLATVWVLLRDYGFGWRERCVLVLLAGLSPVTVIFSFSLMPELLFTALLLASVILAERAIADRSVALAGAARGRLRRAGLSDQIHRAAPLLLTAPLCFALRKQFAKAALFFGAMLPAVAGWQWWVSQHSRTTPGIW